MSQNTATTGPAGRSLDAEVQALAPSDTALFLANLRLLNLDLLPDWPDIREEIILAKNVNQDQKQRVRCVEWALYRLFELYDSNDTREKLQPFFPPLEPLQSLNLRAALYRCLNELKKTGLLGKDTTLRKTMLDDCKGEKLWELLSVFSTMVMRKCLLDNKRGSEAHSMLRLADSSVPLMDKSQNLLPLALAHRVSIVTTLHVRQAAQEQYTKFSNLLTTTSQRLDEREQMGRSRADPEVPADAYALQSRINGLWVANSKWVDLLLHGQEEAGDTLLTQPFQPVWEAVSRGNVKDSIISEAGLLDGLSSRVERQRKRFAKWNAFHKSLKHSRASATLQNRNNSLHSSKLYPDTMVFDKHLELKPGVENAHGEQHMDIDTTLSFHPRYKAIVANMKTELRQATASSKSEKPTAAEPQAVASSRLRPFRLSISPRHDFSATTFRTNSFDSSTRASPSSAKSPLSAGPIHLKVRTKSWDERAPKSPSSASSRFSAGGMAAALPLPAHIHDAEPVANPGSKALSNRSSTTSETLVADSTPARTTEEAMASQILASIADVKTPPFHKSSLSLTERTRLSIAHGLPRQLDSKVSEKDRREHESKGRLADGSGHASNLLERTRLSMSLVPSTMNPPTSRRLSKTDIKKRHSLYPVNQFETPRNKVSRGPLDASEESPESPESPAPSNLPVSDDAEYGAIFKSRPKVAMGSPVFAPGQDSTGSSEEPLGLKPPLTHQTVHGVGLGINGH